MEVIEDIMATTVVLTGRLKAVAPILHPFPEVLRGSRIGGAQQPQQQPFAGGDGDFSGAGAAAAAGLDGTIGGGRSSSRGGGRRRSRSVVGDGITGGGGGGRGGPPLASEAAALTATHVTAGLVASGYSDGSVGLCFFYEDCNSGGDNTASAAGGDDVCAVGGRQGSARARAGQGRSSSHTLSEADLTGAVSSPMPTIATSVAAGGSSGPASRRGSVFKQTAAATALVVAAVQAVHCVPLPPPSDGAGHHSASPSPWTRHLLAVAYRRTVYVMAAECESAPSATAQLAATRHNGRLNPMNSFTGSGSGVGVGSSPRLHISAETLLEAVTAALPPRAPKPPPPPHHHHHQQHPSTAATSHKTSKGGGGGAAAAAAASATAAAAALEGGLVALADLSIDIVTLSPCGGYVAVSVTTAATRAVGRGGGVVVVFNVPAAVAAVAPRWATATGSSIVVDTIAAAPAVAGCQHAPPPWSPPRPTNPWQEAAAAAAAAAGSPRRGTSRRASTVRGDSPISATVRGAGNGRRASCVGSPPKSAGSGRSRARLGGNINNTIGGGVQLSTATQPLPAVCHAVFLCGADDRATTTTTVTPTATTMLLVVWTNSRVYCRVPLSPAPGGPLLSRLTAAVAESYRSCPALLQQSRSQQQQQHQQQQQQLRASSGGSSSKTGAAGSGPSTAGKEAAKSKKTATTGGGRQGSKGMSRVDAAPLAASSCPDAATAAAAMEALCPPPPNSGGGSGVCSGVRYGQTPAAIHQAAAVPGGRLVALGCEGGALLLLDGQRVVSIDSALPPDSHLARAAAGGQALAEAARFVAVTALEASLEPPPLTPVVAVVCGSDGGRRLPWTPQPPEVVRLTVGLSIVFASIHSLPAAAAADGSGSGGGSGSGSGCGGGGGGTGLPRILHAAAAVSMPADLSGGGPSGTLPSPSDGCCRRGCTRRYLVGLPAPVLSCSVLGPLPIAVVRFAASDHDYSCHGGGGGGGVSVPLPTPCLLWDVAFNWPLALLPAGHEASAAPALSADGATVAWLRRETARPLAPHPYLSIAATPSGASSFSASTGDTSPLRRLSCTGGGGSGASPLVPCHLRLVALVRCLYPHVAALCCGGAALADAAAALRRLPVTDRSLPSAIRTLLSPPRLTPSPPVGVVPTVVAPSRPATTQKG